MLKTNIVFLVLFTLELLESDLPMIEKSDKSPEELPLKLKNKLNEIIYDDILLN